MATTKDLPNQIASQLPPQFVLWLKSYVIDILNSLGVDISGLDTTTTQLGTTVTDLESTVDGLTTTVAGKRNSTDYEFGTGDDYSEFEDDGTLKFNGEATVWRDEMNELIGKKLESPASDITVDETSSSLLYDDDSEVADYVMMNVQLNHDWKVGSSIYPHLHWRQGAAAYPNWLIQWRWQIQGEEETASWQYQKVSAHQFTWSAGTLNQISNFGAITAPAGAGISDIVQFRLIRDCSDTSTLYGDSDPLAGDASAVNFDVHIECDTIGSRSEFSK